MTDFHVMLVVCWIASLALLSYLFNKYLRMKRRTSEMDSMLYEEGQNLMKFVMRQAYIIDTPTSFERFFDLRDRAFHLVMLPSRPMIRGIRDGYYEYRKDNPKFVEAEEKYDTLRRQHETSRVEDWWDL